MSYTYVYLTICITFYYNLGSAQRFRSYAFQGHQGHRSLLLYNICGIYLVILKFIQLSVCDKYPHYFCIQTHNFLFMSKIINIHNNPLK